MVKYIANFKFKLIVPVRLPEQHTYLSVDGRKNGSYNFKISTDKEFMYHYNRKKLEGTKDNNKQTIITNKKINNKQLKQLKMSRSMRFPTMWYGRPAKPQISLRIWAV